MRNLLRVLLTLICLLAPAGLHAQVTQTGSILGFTSVAGTQTGTVSTTITVPSDATFVVVGVSAYIGVNAGLTSMTFTKGGVDTTMSKAGGTADNSANWNAGIFYLALPDTGANKTLKWSWAQTPGDNTQIVNISFWKGVDTSSPVRASVGVQAGALPLNTGSLTAVSGDLTIAFTGFFNTAQDGLGNVTTWNNLTNLAKSPVFQAYAEGQWATASPSGSGTVGIGAATKWDEGGIVAISVKQAAGAAATPMRTLLGVGQ